VEQQVEGNVSKKKIYLCGPITGLTYDAARLGWRKEFQDRLVQGAHSLHIEAFSPMRSKAFLEGEKSLSGDPKMYAHVMATTAGIITRDRYDVQTCDLMVANLLGAERVSIGSMVEYGWADAFRKPIITIIEPEGVLPEKPGDTTMGLNSHWHAFVTGLSGYIVHTVEDAVDVAASVLTGGV
jgi:nucleoside 2-deoxyribosyltransferase